MLKRIERCLRKKLLRSSSGVALTEVVVAIVVLALILASVPPVLGVIVYSQYSWNEQRVAESLSRNTMEYIKVISYEPGNGTNPEYDMEPVEAYTPDTYEIDVVAKPIDPETKALLVDPVTKEPVEPGVYDKDLQEITITIYHMDKLVLKTINYKINRLGIYGV